MKKAVGALNLGGGENVLLGKSLLVLVEAENKHEAPILRMLLSSAVQVPTSCI